MKFEHDLVFQHSRELNGTTLEIPVAGVVMIAVSLCFRDVVMKETYINSKTGKTTSLQSNAVNVLKQKQTQSRLPQSEGGKLARNMHLSHGGVGEDMNTKKALILSEA